MVRWVTQPIVRGVEFTKAISRSGLRDSFTPCHWVKKGKTKIPTRAGRANGAPRFVWATRRLTQPRHFADVAPQQPPRLASLLRVLLLAQQSFDPTINLFPLAGLESYFFRGQKKLLNLLQA